MPVYRRHVKAELVKMGSAIDALGDLLDKALASGHLWDVMDKRNWVKFKAVLCSTLHTFLSLRGQSPERHRVMEFVAGLEVAYRGFSRLNGPEVKELIENGAPPGLYSFIEEEVIRQVKADELSRQPPEPSEN
jgi:hypothetical protein